MLVEKFGLDALEALCCGAKVAKLEKGAPRRGERLPWHFLNADGLWLDNSDRSAPRAEREVMDWHPRGDDRNPALPIPFNAAELAAFCLAGGGALLLEQFYDGDYIDEDELSEFGTRQSYLCDLLREAHRLEMAAYADQRVDDGRPEAQQPRDASVAARWLLGDAQLRTAAHKPLAAPQPDSSKLATREALIRAFGGFTGMDMNWFDNLKDSPQLFGARKSKGQGGRGHIRGPLFCPFLVMQWLIDPKRKKGRRMPSETGWRLLKARFPAVYADHAREDPKAD